MATQLDEKLKGAVHRLEDMRLAGVKFDQDAGENMMNVEDKITQINEAQRVSMEAINQKTEAVTRQATSIGQQIISEVDSRLKAMGTDTMQIRNSPAGRPPRTPAGRARAQCTMS